MPALLRGRRNGKQPVSRKSRKSLDHLRMSKRDELLVVIYEQRSELMEQRSEIVSLKKQLRQKEVEIQNKQMVG